MGNIVMKRQLEEALKNQKKQLLLKSQEQRGQFIRNLKSSQELENEARKIAHELQINKIKGGKTVSAPSKRRHQDNPYALMYGEVPPKKVKQLRKKR